MTLHKRSQRWIVDWLAFQWAKAQEINYSRGKRDGLMVEWFSNRQKKMEGFFKQGIQNGIFTFYNENGNKMKETMWGNGEQNGKLSYWFENGNKKSVVNFTNNKLKWAKNSQREDFEKKLATRVFRCLGRASPRILHNVFSFCGDQLSRFYD